MTSSNVTSSQERIAVYPVCRSGAVIRPMRFMELDYRAYRPIDVEMGNALISPEELPGSGLGRARSMADEPGMHVAVHPVAFRGAVQRYLRERGMRHRMYYWRRVAKGEAPISWDEARGLLEDYDSMHNGAPVPCVVVSPLTHGQLLAEMSRTGL